MVRLYFQVILILAIVSLVLQLMNRIEISTQKLMEMWNDDYNDAFCLDYFSWRQNIETSHDWLEKTELPKQVRIDAHERLEQEKLRMEAYWNDELQFDCELLEDRIAVYFQENQDLLRPYPNWMSRYLETPHE